MEVFFLIKYMDTKGNSATATLASLKGLLSLNFPSS